MPKPTKASINEAISNTNGALAWAREHVRANDWAAARHQIDAAQVTLLLAKVRIEEREKTA